MSPLADSVLCLEDDPLDAELLEHAVRTAVPDVRWRHARTRADFERELQAERPDLVLADYRLPDTDGLAALDRTRELCGETAFVVVSGAISEAFAIESLKRGATDYVLKQRLQRLGPVAARALAEARTRRELAEFRRLALDIGEREQQRLGADLHDAVGQDLAAVALLLEDAEQRALASAPAIAPRLAESRRLLRRAAEGVRTLSRTLTPVHGSSGSLGAMLRSLARDASGLYGMECRVDVPDGEPALDESTSLHLYRVAQEALTNAAKHGRARTARVSLDRTGGRLVLEIADDGAGIDPVRARQADGLGLRLMGYRARVVGARLDVQRGSTGGTVVRVIGDAAADPA